MENKRNYHVGRYVFLGVFILIILLMTLYCGAEVVRLIKAIMRNPRDFEMSALIRHLGWKGVFTVILGQALTIFLIVVPSVPIQVFAGYAYGIGWGSLICFAGICLGSTVLFIVVRMLGSGLNRIFRNNKTYQKLFGVIQNPNVRVWLFAVLLYLVPVLPYGLICCLLGNTRLRTWQFSIISAFAGVLDVCVNTAVGVGLSADNKLILIISGAVFVLLFVLFAVFKDKLLNKVILISSEGVDALKKKTPPEG